MLKQVINRWDESKNELKAHFEAKETIYSYDEIVNSVVELILNSDPDNNDDFGEWGKPHVINDGDWQGTLMYVIPKKTYQPSFNDYIVTTVSYGSCSGCDTLQAVNDCAKNERTSGYMSLALHIIQSLKFIYE